MDPVEHVTRPLADEDVESEGDDEEGGTLEPSEIQTSNGITGWEKEGSRRHHQACVGGNVVGAFTPTIRTLVSLSHAASLTSTPQTHRPSTGLLRAVRSPDAQGLL